MKKDAHTITKQDMKDLRIKSSMLGEYLNKTIFWRRNIGTEFI